MKSLISLYQKRREYIIEESVKTIVLSLGIFGKFNSLSEDTTLRFFFLLVRGNVNDFKLVELLVTPNGANIYMSIVKNTSASI